MLLYMLSTIDYVSKEPRLLIDVVDKINKFSVYLNEQLHKINKKYFLRQRKLTLPILVYIMTLTNATSHSDQTILDRLKVENIISITKQSLNDKC